MAIELGHGDGRVGRVASKKRKCTSNDEEEALPIVRDMAKTMRHSYSATSAAAVKDFLAKRSRLGEYRNAQTQILMNLLAQKRDLRESGPDQEEEEIVDLIHGEIYSCKERLSRLRQEEQKMKIVIYCGALVGPRSCRFATSSFLKELGAKSR